MKKWITFILVFSLFSHFSHAQEDDLMDLVDDISEPTVDYTIATFKSTRVVSGHSVETNAAGVLQFLVGHRFGRLNSGWRDLFGLDNATIRVGLDYGITDNIDIGVGRSSFQKTYDGMIKWRFLRQQTGAKNFPFTATFVSTIYMDTREWADPDRVNYFSSRLHYNHSLLLARKFGSGFSLQLMPSIVHRNLVATMDDKNTLFAIGAGTSIKVNGSVRINAEYHHIPKGQIVSLIGGEKVQNSLSIGVDLETGGHVFQFQITNSRGMTERFLVGETTGNWLEGDIHFGFNISRVFTVKKPKEFRND